MPSAKNNMKLDKSFEEIIKERFVHSLSNIIYDKVSALWHVDKESEKFMARIAANVVLGTFCLEYLSHINLLIKEKAKITENITAADLSDKDLMTKVKAALSGNKEAASLFRNAASQLKKIIEVADIKTLEDLTKIAHTSDYLLSSLQDMKDSNHGEYTIWLSSIPYYYEKDLMHLGLMKEARFKAQDIGLDLDSYYSTPVWNAEFPAEPFYTEKIYSNHRINLNAHRATKEGYFPCIQSKGKGKRINSRTRS